MPSKRVKWSFYERGFRGASFHRSSSRHPFVFIPLPSVRIGWREPIESNIIPAQTRRVPSASSYTHPRGIVLSVVHFKLNHRTASLFASSFFYPCSNNPLFLLLSPCFSNEHWNSFFFIVVDSYLLCLFQCLLWLVIFVRVGEHLKILLKEFATFFNKVWNDIHSCSHEYKRMQWRLR